MSNPNEKQHEEAMLQNDECKSEKNEKKLMNKTKKELVQIIFRKDDTEKTLRKQRDDYQLDLTKAKNMVDTRDNTIKKLNTAFDEEKKNVAQYQAVIDELTTDNTILKNKIRKGIVWNWVISIGIILGTILYFVL